MAPYVLFYVINSLFSWVSRRNFLIKVLAPFFVIYSMLFIGLRYEIGADWYNYLDFYYYYKDAVFGELIAYDFGYALLNYIAGKLELGIAGVNTFCAFVFSYGLVKFALRQHYPWVAISAAISYLLTVVAMGYTRQSVAIGFILWALSEFDKGKKNKVLFLLFLAVILHFSSAVILAIFIFLFLSKKIDFKRVFFVIFIAALFGYYSYRRGQIGLIDYVVSTYLESTIFHSVGAIHRIGINVFVSILYLIFLRHFKKYQDHKIWFLFAILQLILVPFVFRFSTFVDRVSLYFQTIQLVFFSRFLEYFEDKNIKAIVLFLIIAFYFSVLLVWLIYGHFSEYWIPYKSFITQ